MEDDGKIMRCYSIMEMPLLRHIPLLKQHYQPTVTTSIELTRGSTGGEAQRDRIVVDDDAAPVLVRERDSVQP
jgi:hypothetical protein